MPESLAPKEPGAYEVRGVGDERVTEGVCAACLGSVTGADAYVIRYHPKKRGGIFHRSCDPSSQDPLWYPLDAVEGAENV